MSAPAAAPTSVAVIGLGRMGGSIADHIIAAGHDVRVYDIAEKAVAPRVAAGATASSSPADAARGASFVNVVVFDDAQAVAVVAGDDGVLTTLEAGSVVSIHTTVSLDTIDDLAARAEAQGVFVLDAGISGGEDGAAAGTLLTMVGGPADAVDQARPVLLSFSKEVLHPGPLGAGMALKLARNSTGYVMMAAVHEAMELAARSGVDLELLRHTIAETGVLEQALVPLSLGGPEPMDETAPEGLRTVLEHTNRLAEKDLDQALDLAAGNGASVPVIDAVRRNFHRVVRL
ncbi:MAG: NAD(P)-dependent oxidoreductase [Acidimicrobiia bacterium]|nr:NAD(P)-dependent oxidoreductase [Acidimicrobiia bacterium]